MKNILTAIAGVAFVAAASSAYSQINLPQVWKVDAGDNAWFDPAPGTDNNTRGFDVDTTRGLVYVADRGVQNTVQILNAANGTANTTATIGGGTAPYTLGTFVLNKVNVAADGFIYVTNLAAATSTFKVYRHADPYTTPTLAYNATATPVRLGDDAIFRGAGNNTRGYVHGSTNQSGIYLSTTDGGVTFTGTTITATALFTGNPNVAPDPDNADIIWYRQSGSGTAGSTASQILLNLAGTTASLTGQILAPQTVGTQGIDVQIWNGVKSIAQSNGSNTPAASSGFRGFIYRADNNTTLAQTAATLEKVGGSRANGNGAGNVRFYPSADRLFVLITNNSLSAHGLTVSAGASDWNLYDM